jgi:hypothetical protein
MLGSIIVLAMLVGGVLLWAVLKSFQASPVPEPSPAAPTHKAVDPRIQEARRGDAVAVRDAGHEVAFTVDRIDRFETGPDEWFRLTGLWRRRRVYLEWKGGNRVRAFLDVGREVDIEEFGLDEERLAQMDDEQSRDNVAERDGRRWQYESSCETGFFEDGRGEGEGFYRWSFLSEDGRERLAIEKWEGVPFTARVCRRVDPGQVKVRREA